MKLENFSMRQEYGSKEADKLFVYFMKTVLRIQKNGLLEIPLDVTFGEPVDAYLKVAVALMEGAHVPEMASLALQIEREYILAHHAPTKEQITLMVLIERLTLHVRYDAEPAEYLLDCENLFFNNAPYPGEISAAEYVAKTFICNLSDELKRKQWGNTPLHLFPEDFFRPDDF